MQLSSSQNLYQLDCLINYITVFIGGVYYIISRSLGPEFGASVGLILAFANAVAASMNTIGFCNSLNDLFAEYNVTLIDGGVNNVRVIGIVSILIMVIICAVGMEWESKVSFNNFSFVSVRKINNIGSIKSFVAYK